MLTTFLILSDMTGLTPKINDSTEYQENGTHDEYEKSLYMTVAKLIFRDRLGLSYRQNMYF